VFRRFHQASDGWPQHQLDPRHARVLRDPRLHHHHGGGAGAGSSTRPASSHHSLDAINEALEELQLHALDAHAPGRNQLLDFDFGRLERQLAIFLV
jgi:hypothetical protein